MRLIRWSVLVSVLLLPASLYPRTRAVDRPEPNPPRLVSFSGQVAHVVGKGNIGVSFAIYKQAEGGTALWMETQNVEVDENGRFTVNLGAATEGGIPLDLFTSGEGRWLSIQRIPEVEQQRILLASVAYALKAADAETLGGKPMSSFILADETNSVKQKDGTRTLKPKVNTSGTTNYIGKFTDSTNLGNSILYDTGAAVGLLTVSPVAPLHINSVMTYRAVNVGSVQTGAFPGVMFENTATGTSGLISENNGLIFFTRGNSASFVGSDQRMIITSAGRVGIATNAPQGPLHIGSITTYRNLNLGSIQTGAYPGILLENTATGSSVAITESNGLAMYIKNSASAAFTGSDLKLSADQSGTLTLAGNLALPSTASSSAGVITLSDIPFAHNFGSSNTFLGANAGNFTMSGAGTNTAVGDSALQSNTTGYRNTASGASALLANTTGDSNTAIGTWALLNNTTGFSNMAIGVAALGSNTDGFENTASGNSTLQSSSSAFRNTASGARALSNNTTGNNNTASGAYALNSNTTGSANTAVGSFAGQNLTTGSNNIDIGNNGVAAESGTIRIGTGGTQTRAFLAGVRGITTGVADGLTVLIDSAGQLGTTSSSARVKRDITGMGEQSSALMKLRPVSFYYRNDGAGIRQYGLIAEEVAEVMPELVQFSPAGEAETVRYHFLAPLLLDQVQKQHRRIEEQDRRNVEQQRTIDRLEQRLQALERQVAGRPN